MHVNSTIQTYVFGFIGISHNDTPLIVTVLVNSMLPKTVTVSKYLLTVTLFPCPGGGTVTEDVSIC